MSCIFVVTPLVVVAGGWPVFCAAAVAAGASLGYRRIQQGAKVVDETPVTEIEVSMENSRVVAETMVEDQKIVLERDGVQVEFYKDARGKFSVHVRGRGVDKKALEEAGEELIGKIRQQYAYQKIMAEMEKRGYSVRAEERKEDKSIRIRLERMG